MDRARTECERSVLLLGHIWYVTLFFQLVESVVPLRVSVFKIAFVIISVLLVKLILIDYRAYLPQIVKNIGNIVKNIKFVIVFLGLYIIFDIVSFLYTEDIKYASVKYIVVIEMLIFAGIYLVYIVISGEAYSKCKDKLLLTIAASGVAVSSIAVVNYFMEFFPLLYIRRLSTLADYNQFATIIVLGYLAGFLYLIEKSERNARNMALLSALSVLELSTVYLSGSRRAFIIEIFIVIFLVVFISINILRLKTERGKRAKNVCKFMVITIIGCVLLVGLMQYQFNRNYENGKHSMLENNVDENFSTIFTGQAMGKRSIIWTIAFDELKTYNAKELLLGKGSSYSSDLYDSDVKEKLMNKYSQQEKDSVVRHWMFAHNFLLSDMLTGGIIKLGFSLGLLFSIIIYLFKLKVVESKFWFLSIMIGVTYINAFLSFRYGFLGDKNYWFCLLLLLISLENDIKSKERNKYAV